MEVPRMRILGVLLAVLSLTAVPDADACSCMPSHPQTLFCRADFVILARIVREFQPDDHTRIYKVRMLKTFKMSEKAVVALKGGRLLTASYGSMCGIHYEVGKVYAISGHVASLQARVNLCGFSRKWREMTPRQRNGMRSVYSKGCHCDIEHVRRGSPPRIPNVCFYSSDCMNQYGACQRSASFKCKWVRNKFMRQCLRNETIVQRRANPHPPLKLELS